MLASQLRPEQFKNYPPQARRLVIDRMELLRQLPTILMAILLREIIAYDWKFPAEREELDRQLKYLGSLQPEQLRTLLAKFSAIDLSPALEQLDWVKEPEVFSERLTAYLWSTHQIDAFRLAANEYSAKLQQVAPVQPPRIPRLGIAVIGRGVAASDFPLFRKLRPHGVLFTQIKPENGLQILVHAVSARAAAHPEPYRHWHIDGGTAVVVGPQVTGVSYDALQPVRTAVLHRMQKVIQSGSGGPELMETTIVRISPEELGMTDAARDHVLDHFQVNLLTEGSGTQIFSTTFVLWAAREALRRAQPDTLLARFTPRQRQRPMNELLDGKTTGVELDAHGSLVDADMGSYYIWLDQQRLANAEQASFLVWFEERNLALGIGPTLPRGTQSDSPADLGQLLQWIS
ncbi:MAG: hypothetical protein WA708_18555 [Acidobacteriaceae bacterium]